MFKRENRYIVLKRKDVVAALTEQERETLANLCDKVCFHRIHNEKPQLECVVVERDWPEYEPTWKAIEKRMTPKKPEQPKDDGYWSGWED